MAGRDALAELEDLLASDDMGEALSNRLVLVALVAGNGIEVPPDELNAATRRALLVLASGGDPTRALDLRGRAVESMASDLGSNERRSALTQQLEVLSRSPHPRVAETARSLAADPQIGWRAFAAARLAEQLEEDED
ncbi:MAG: hypothetical protein ACE5EV_04935 [Gaiellales bacterium]